jgi:LysR family nitrogen assimilation transcriptional regulator
MDLKQLEYFVRVAELGGFTKAANVLSVAQPALSKQIRQLEVELQRNLLVRNGRGVSLTEEGAMLLSHAKGILEQVDRARQEIRDIQGLPIGKVVVAAPPAAGMALLAQTQLVTSFRERFPKAQLEVIEAKTWTIYEWLLVGRVDIGILYDPRPSPVIEITPLGEEEVCLVSRKSDARLAAGKPIPFRQLSRYPLIIPSYPHAMRALADTMAAKAGIKLDIAIQIEGVAFILELVNKGLGYTLLPRSIIETSHLAAKLQINPFVGPRMARTLTVAVSSQRRVTHLTRETVKLVLHYLQLGAKR